VHAGSINAEFRDPRPIFEALGRLIKLGSLAANECDVRFIGPGDYASSGDVAVAVEAAGLTGAVTFSPRVPYNQSLLELASADVLLLLQASDDTAGLVPAKLYEYLRIGRPVLALVRAGAAAEIIDQTHGGWAVDPRHQDALDAALGEMVAAWRTGGLPKRSARIQDLRRFERRALSQELARVLDSVSRVAHGAVGHTARWFPGG
jgi:glycosyltransferase involved in cell wall biosynthesis